MADQSCCRIVDDKDIPSVAQDWTGSTLSRGRYRVLSRLGEGGMGFVYKAHDQNLDTDVVIKVPRLAILEDPQFSHRFQREIRSLVSLSHPHIVKILDVGEYDGVPFAVMQYLPGGDLEERRPLDALGIPLPQSPTSLSVWLLAIAKALDYVHRQHHVHRDIKPSNILFDADNNPYLSDFGIAKVIAGSDATHHNLTATGLVIGTPDYMAPELIMGHVFDGRADQYALAMTVYEILAGRLPFSGPTPAAILVKQATEAVPPLHSLAAVSPALSVAVTKALSKVPSNRFAVCSEFAEAVMETVGNAGTPTTKAASVFAAAQVLPAEASLTCPSCLRSLRVAAKLAGRTARCPGCQAPLCVAHDLSFVTMRAGDTISSSSRRAVTPPQIASAASNRSSQLEPVTVNSIGMKLVLIPSGEFIMGSPANERGRGNDEGPQHRVRITRPFYLGAYEVTQSEYEKVMGVNPSRFQGSQNPMENVSWHDAVSFYEKLSALPQETLAGRVYRLPTEAEWEYACRAGSNTAYSFGDDSAQLVDYAWFGENLPGGMHSVGEKSPSAWGLYDMHGHVWEWCQDWYDAEYYAKSPAADPPGPMQGSGRVLRGGSWDSPALRCRAAGRFWIRPDNRCSGLGFRVAAVPSACK